MNFGVEMLWKATPVSIERLYFLITALPQGVRSVVKSSNLDVAVKLPFLSN
jgi:hypothetical protein